ncbi:FERM, ARHGEF and pleckstrin domain-containing protein 2-like [Ornithodoros turicata]
MTSAGGQSDRATSPDGGRAGAATSRPGSGRLLAVQVHMLDETVSTFHVQYKATGRVLFDQVCRVINLLEVDYFGLEYTDSSGTKYWLDYDKPLCRQMGLSMVSPVMCFAVKFYTPDPAQLEEEFTRYLFSLQIKKDLSLGILQCSDSTAALLASYIVQASCGDFVTEDYPDHSYLSSYKFVPHQDAELEIKIMENHKKHVSQSPAEADLNLLETARRCELYGIRMTPAKDNEGLALNLSVAHMGIIVFQNYTKINTFSWSKIRKLSFKRKKFLIKLHPEGYGYYKEMVDYFFESRNECKNFWKKCIENHSFFRCTEVKKIPRQKTRLFSRGSSFRYSGRTQKQIVEYVRENYVKRQPFQRSTSLRLPSRSNVETPAVPSLLPVSSSRSCGSVAMSFEVPASEPSAPPMLTAVSEPNSPRRDSARHPQEGPLTPSQDTDDNISHDSYRLEEGDSSAAPHTEPGSPITIELHAPPPPPPCLRTGQSHESSAEVHNGGLPVAHSMSPEAPQSPDLSYSFRHDASGQGGADSSVPASPQQESCSDVRRKKYPNEKAYFITKELVMTERTYKKHLEVILLYFKEKVEKEDADNVPAEALAILFSSLDPIYKVCISLLRDLEQRLAAWEGKLAPGSYCNIHGIGGLLLDYCHITELYDHYLEKLPRVLEDLQGSCHHNPYFERLYREFERQKECYLPLALFLLHPAHRLLHYCQLLQRLHESYDSNHADNVACLDILQRLRKSTSLHKESLCKLENFVMLMELQHDLIGVDNLMQPGRNFIREGCLQKLSRKGYQQRMFFLFSDVLIYASRASTPQLQFKVHGQLPLQSLSVDETEPKAEAAFRFNIYAANRALMVAASSEEERQKWMKALSDSIAAACSCSLKDERLHYSSLKSCHSSDERLDRLSQEGQQSPGGAAERHVQHRSNTAVHVCWHRNTSVGRDDHKKAHRNYLSGFLLRKFKNSSGWQKLWVVFTNFCLFFYKSYHESSPLASLPLVGYTVTLPGPNDNINKDFVFKLQFKTHVYFFRAESEYAFARWVEVISIAAVKKM